MIGDDDIGGMVGCRCGTCLSMCWQLAVLMCWVVGIVHCVPADNGQMYTTGVGLI